MKKIPTIFERNFSLPESHPDRGKITKVWHSSCLLIKEGKGVATYKWDGTSVMFNDGAYFKRYDAKRGKVPPLGFMPCGDPDPVTGHYTGWLKVDNKPENKWHLEALERYGVQDNGTYELIGPKLQGNPHNVDHHQFKRHGDIVVENFPRDYENMKVYFEKNGPMEGVVFWLHGAPVAKIKATDFDIKWK